MSGFNYSPDLRVAIVEFIVEVSQHYLRGEQAALADLREMNILIKVLLQVGKEFELREVTVQHAILIVDAFIEETKYEVSG